MKRLYQNELKNRNVGKEAYQNSDLEREITAKRQGSSENQNSDERPTLPKIDSSSCFGIKSSTLFLLISGLWVVSLISNEPAPCAWTPRPILITARHIEPRGIGYSQGYTTLEGFFSLPHLISDRWLPFLDVRSHLFNNGNFASNFGTGCRYLNSRIWGGTLYYDYRHTHKHSYHQIGFGLESLGKWWDLRLNGYFPMGTTKSDTYHTRFDRLHKHYALLSHKREFALKGADAEIGTHVEIKKCPLYFAAGPYYLCGYTKATWGGQARATIDIHRYFSLETNASYDSLFQWIGQGQIGLHLPLGSCKPISRKKRGSCIPPTLISNIFQKVGRHEIIPTHTQTKTFKAIDPSTGKPYVFWFVDNTSHSKGTFESPFPTLSLAAAHAAPGNIIYVFPGDGTMTGMNDGIALQNNQQLLGSAISHPLRTPQGTFIIPSLSSITPTIGNANGASNVVSVMNNNTISGFCINNFYGHGIAQQTPEITALTATYNVITGNNTYYGLSLSNLSGPLTLTQNLITAQYGGLSIQNGDIVNGIYNLNDNQIFTVQPGVIMTFTNSKNIITSLVNSLILSQLATAVEINLSNTANVDLPNTLSIQNCDLMSGAYAFSSSLQNAAYAIFNIDNSTLISVDSSAAFIGHNTSLFNASVTNSSLTSQNPQLGTTPGTFYCTVDGDAQGTLLISRNQIVSDQASFFLSSGGTGSDAPQLNVTIANNVLFSDWEPAGSGMVFKASAYGTLNLLMTSEDSHSFSRGSNAQIYTQDNAQANFTFRNNVFAGSTDENISINPSDNSVLRATFDHNQINAASKGHGLGLFAFDNSLTTLCITDNQFTGNSDGACELNIFNSAQLRLRLQENTALPTQGLGGDASFFVSQNDLSTVLVEPITNNEGTIALIGTITPVPPGFCNE